MQWMHGYEVACPVDGRGRDVVAAAQNDVIIPRGCGGYCCSELARGGWVADQYRAVPPLQPDRHSHVFGRGPIKLIQILNIDDTEYQSKKSASRPADAPGEIHAWSSGHTTLRQRTDEHFGTVMVSAPAE